MLQMSAGVEVTDQSLLYSAPTVVVYVLVLPTQACRSPETLQGGCRSTSTIWVHMFMQFTGSAGFVDFIRGRVEPYGLRLSFAELDDVTVAAYAGTVRSRYARPDPAASATP